MNISRIRRGAVVALTATALVGTTALTITTSAAATGTPHSTRPATTKATTHRVQQPTAPNIRWNPVVAQAALSAHVVEMVPADG